MTTEWLFTDPPEVAERGQTGPVLVREEVAVRLLLTDLVGLIERVVCDHPVVGVEAAGSVTFRSSLALTTKAKAAFLGNWQMGEDRLSGWSTSALVNLDDKLPGILSRVLTAAPARRQAIFAALAAREVNDGHFGQADRNLGFAVAELAVEVTAMPPLASIG